MILVWHELAFPCIPALPQVIKIVLADIMPILGQNNTVFAWKYVIHFKSVAILMQALFSRVASIIQKTKGSFYEQLRVNLIILKRWNWYSLGDDLKNKLSGFLHKKVQPFLLLSPVLFLER